MRLKNTPAPWQLQGIDGGIYQLKVVDIGNWDMDANVTKNVVHGLDSTKIRGCWAFIRQDGATYDWYNLEGFHTGSGLHKGLVVIKTTNVELGRLGGGYFDSVTFNDNTINRGHVIILYAP